MGRIAILVSLAAVLAACSSTTNLDEIELVGEWDGVGALQSSPEGFGITLFIQTHTGGSNGNVTGSWRRVSSVFNQGSIAAGATQNGQITFRLSGFPGDDPTFTGRLTNQHRMEGSFDALQLTGSAVFRRRSLRSSAP